MTEFLQAVETMAAALDDLREQGMRTEVDEELIASLRAAAILVWGVADELAGDDDE